MSQLLSDVVSLLDDVEVLTVMLTRASDILGPILSMVLKNRCKVDARVFGYAEEVVPLYRLDDLRRHFRVQRSTFAVLVRLLSSYTDRANLCLASRRGRPPLSCEKQLPITRGCLLVKKHSGLWQTDLEFVTPLFIEQ